MRNMNILKRDGFTLLEILIAIFILTTVLTTVYAAYTGTFSLIKDTMSGDTIYSMARTALNRMAEDVELACRYRGSVKFISREPETGDVMELSFLSSSHLDFDDERSSGIAMIDYFIAKDDDEDTYILKRRDVLYRGIAREAKEGGYMLCRGLQSLTYKFYDESGAEHDYWDSGSPLTVQSNRLPSVVMIQMNFVNPKNTDTPYRFMTKVALPMGGNR